MKPCAPPRPTTSARPQPQRMRTDMQKHVKDISEKYLIPGETQTPALMFVPSESIYAELHMTFSDLVQRARRAQVVIVCPHVFMLAINTIQTLMRDAKMREQAHRIQKEVALLLVDVNRLSDRIGNLRNHFDRTNKDIGEIETSMKKIGSPRHGHRAGRTLRAGRGQSASESLELQRPPSPKTPHSKCPHPDNRARRRPARRGPAA